MLDTNSILKIRRISILKELVLSGLVGTCIVISMPEIAKADEIRLLTTKSINCIDGITGHSLIAWFSDDGRLRRTVAQWPGGLRFNDPTDVSMARLQNCPDCNWRSRKVSGIRGSFIMSTVVNKYNRPYVVGGVFLYTCTSFATDMWRETTNGKEIGYGWTPSVLNYNVSTWNKWQKGAWFDNGKAWL